MPACASGNRVGAHPANPEALLDQERQTLGDLQAQMAFVDEQMMEIRVAHDSFQFLNLPNNAGLAILNVE